LSAAAAVVELVDTRVLGARS